MKTTIDLPDELLLEAKQRALNNRTTLRAILERALRRELKARAPKPPRSRRIRWVTSRGGLPPGLDLSDRSKMWEWMQRGRVRDRH